MGFTVFQPMTVLEESHHSIILIEHDPLLYENAAKMTEYVSIALREAAGFDAEYYGKLLEKAWMETAFIF